MYIDKSIKHYIDALAEKTPTPGGGSVAALLGSLGCALISMVAGYTLARDGFNGYKERAKKTLKDSEALMKRLIILIDEDIAAYEKLSRALKRYRNEPAKLQPSIRQSVMPPSKICACVHKAAILCQGLVYIGNKSLLSDVCSAIYVLDAAFESALLNIEANLKLIGDKDYAVRSMHRYSGFHKDMKKIKTEVLSKAKERMQ